MAQMTILSTFSNKKDVTVDVQGLVRKRSWAEGWQNSGLVRGQGRKDKGAGYRTGRVAKRRGTRRKSDNGNKSVEEVRRGGIRGEKGEVDGGWEEEIRRWGGGYAKNG